MKQKLTFVIAVCLFSAVAVARTFNSQSEGAYNLKYVVNEDGRTVTCNGFAVYGTSGEEDLIIPTEVVDNGITYHVTAIGQGAFSDYSMLTGGLVIGDSVKTIGDKAFNACTGFTGELIFPNSVLSIGSLAFYNCIGFSGDLIISESVETIGNMAFQTCTGFTGDLVIGNSVKKIGSHAFYGCNGFRGILVIGSSLDSIDSQAFHSCNNFKNMDVKAATPPILESDVFYGMNSDMDIIVPNGCLDEYVSSSDWDFLGGLDGVATNYEDLVVDCFTQIQNTIYFSVPTQVSLYSISGVNIFNGNVVEYELPNKFGIYVMHYKTEDGKQQMAKVLSK